MRCLKCNQFFQEVAWISYQEYAGASYQKEPVSPCCHSQYEDDDQAQMDAFADAEVERAEQEYQTSEECGHFMRVGAVACSVCVGEVA